MPITAKNFDAIFARLVKILEPYKTILPIQDKIPGMYSLGIKNPKHPNQWVAAVRISKNYVGFHLMPIYAHPELLNTISPELKKHMQGKSCFNFKTINEPLFAELETLTAESFKKSKSDPWFG